MAPALTIPQTSMGVIPPALMLRWEKRSCQCLGVWCPGWGSPIHARALLQDPRTWRPSGLDFCNGYKTSSFSASSVTVAQDGQSMERDYEYSSKCFLKDLDDADELDITSENSLQSEHELYQHLKGSHQTVKNDDSLARSIKTLATGNRNDIFTSRYWISS